MKDLQAYLLLEKPLSELALSSEAVEFLRAQGIETVGELLDREWALFPAAIADEVRQAAVDAGLRARQTADEAEEVESTPQQAWDFVLSDEPEPHGYRVDSGDEADFALLARDERWATMESLTVMHWAMTDDHRDDFRPWFDALMRHPPSSLRVLAFGGYGDRSRRSILGSVPELVRRLPQLEELYVIGGMEELEPLSSTSLRVLTLDTFEPPALGWTTVLEASDLPALTQCDLFADPGAAEDVVPIFRCAALESIALSGPFMLSAEFVEEAAKMPARPAVLFMANCRTPFEVPEREQALFDAFVHTADDWSDTTIVLPEDALDFEDQLAEAGLACSYGY